MTIVLMQEFFIYSPSFFTYIIIHLEYAVNTQSKGGAIKYLFDIIYFNVLISACISGRISLDFSFGRLNFYG